MKTTVSGSVTIPCCPTSDIRARPDGTPTEG
jgi:hypothetical protein